MNSGRLITVLQRTLLAVFGLQILVALGLSVVDAYRRRNKRPTPFPVTQPGTVEVGEATLTTYTYGQHLFDAMLEAIDSAREQILFETYIWKGDAVGQQFKDALIRAAERGVAVHVIYDGFANLVVPPSFKRFPDSVSVLRYPTYPAGLRFWDISRYGRDHRKILVVDEEIAFVGGFNVGDAYASEWRDTHVRATGPVVHDLARAVADFWNLNRRRRFGRSQGPLLVRPAPEWEPEIRVHRNVPRLWMFPIRSVYIEAITKATRNIWMTHAYFLPDADMVDAIIDAAHRGVDVRIILPLKSNHIVADWISRGYFSELLNAGVKVLRYRDAMVHAKTATIDGSWSTVGTANIDRLSLTGNYEINLEVIDEAFAQQMEKIFVVDESNTLELTATEWEARDLHRKFTEMLLAPLRGLL